MIDAIDVAVFDHCTIESSLIAASAHTTLQNDLFTREDSKSKDTFGA